MVKYTYDRNNKMVSYTDAENVMTSYAYDGNGLRVLKGVETEEGVKNTRFLYDRQHVILETDESNVQTARYVRGLSYIAKIGVSNSVSYYEYNAYGDVVQMVSPSGAIQNSYEYDIFGSEVLNVTESEPNAIRYAGEYTDPDTGIIYLRARDYDSSAGRFTTEDTYKGDRSNPATRVGLRAAVVLRKE